MEPVEGHPLGIAAYSRNYGLGTFPRRVRGSSPSYPAPPWRYWPWLCSSSKSPRAGSLSIVGLMLLAPALAEVALKFGPPEYFCLMLLGLVIVTFLAGSSMAKALLMAAFGLFLGLVGMDIMTASTSAISCCWC